MFLAACFAMVHYWMLVGHARCCLQQMHEALCNLMLPRCTSPHLTSPHLTSSQKESNTPQSMRIESREARVYSKLPFQLTSSHQHISNIFANAAWH